MLGRKILIWGGILFFLMMLPCLGEEKPKLGTSLESVSEILNPDVSLNLKEGLEGSFDLKGFRMVAKQGEAPRFVPDSSSKDRTATAGIMLASGDENWDGQFGVPGMNYDVYALAMSGTILYAGGWFTTAGGVAANNIAKWDGTSWSALGSGMNNYVTTLAASGTTLYAGGDFTTAGGVAANNIAKWDGTSWSALGSGMNDTVFALAVSGTTLYAGGDFTTAGEVDANHIAKWDGTSWSALGSGMNNRVIALAVSGATLYAGGLFTTAGGVDAHYIARWDGTSWSALGSGINYPGMNGGVDALAVSGAALYAGGLFSFAGGVAANRIAKWDGTSWSALGSGMNDVVWALAVSGTTLYAGGYFTTAGGVAANHIAKWDGTSWSALGSGMNDVVWALAMSGADLYAGGYFTTAGGKQSNYIACWHSTFSEPAHVLFDDFDYPTNESLYSGIWFALPQARDKITVSEGGANYGELNLFLPSGYEGKDGGDPNAPGLWTINHYNGGTYFARVWFTDQPLHNYDPICEAFWLQNSSKLEKTGKYSEHDFEYLPYDSWDLHNPKNYAAAIWTTSWLKNIGCSDDRQNFQKKVALGDKWVELMMKIKPNQSVEFYVFDDTGTLVDGYPWHGDTQYAPRTESAMQIFFNMWLENGATSKASYKMKVDYMLFIQNETTYQRSDLIALANYYRMNYVKSKDTTVPLPAESIGTSDFLGTWDGQGVYYRNSDTNGWSPPLASPATVIASGYLDCDVVHDILGIWPNQSGVWVKYSRKGSWAKLSSTAKHIAVGDMNGDGRDDLLATWDGQGVYYRNSMNGAWVTMASPATLITAGDLDGDGKDDLIGIWPSQGGVWVKYSKTGAWAKLSSTAKDIAAGDMNGDGRDDLLATWDGQGVYYRNSMNGAWVKMSTPADQVTCGDLDGDAKADLIGIWPMQGGVWVKYSATKTWERLSSTARDIAAGKMRNGTGGSTASQALFGPMGGYAQGPESLIQYQDTSSEGPGGLHFVYQIEELLIPQEHESEMMRIPGPGESGFRCAEEENLIPEESRDSSANRNDIDRSKK